MTTITPVAEHKPILSIGFHPLTVDQLRELCVNRFPESTTRKAVMAGLEEVMNRLTDAGIHVEIWVDGSFLTQKRDPPDSDIVLRVPIEVYEKGSDAQRAALDWVKSNQKQNHLCDSYIFYVFPSGDGRSLLNDYYHAYWIHQFGFSRGREMKGIAVLRSGDES